ncbi:MAG: hydrogenase maturation protease [Acidimicrobiia bacterium]
MTAARLIGVGNDFRRDDGVGLRAADLAEERLGATVEVYALDGEPTRVIDAWDGAELAIVVDGVRSGAEPGTIHRLVLEPGDPDRPDPEAGRQHDIPEDPRARSSHAAGPGEAVALARALGRMPRKLLLYGVEGGDFGEGPGLSPAVERALDDVMASITRDLETALP